MSKPQPVAVTVICSLCDQPWDDHGLKPSQDDCVRLLKAALAAKSPVPVIVYRDRYPYQVGPYWYASPSVGTGHFTYTSGSQSTTAFGTTTNAIEFRSPLRGDEDPPAAVAV
jgi:hypothetical protein